MEAFASAAPEPSPHAKRRRNGLAKNCEELLCNVAKYFPLAFVYGLTTWAIWVEAGVSIYHTRSWWKGTLGAVLGISIYLLMNTSYTVAVFTDPGTPLKTSTRGRPRHQYSHLPTTEDPEYTSVTVNSLGDMRYCKKCQSRKPDRTHHCSTCGQCVLKMDHHCPWLATCVGMYNYKAFLLFLIYTCLFCYVCFAISVLWVWDEMMKNAQYMERFLPVNVIVLAVVSGMMSLVLTGFAGWHVSLAARGLTTIECLEKTRYLAPVRKTLDRQRRGWQQNQPRTHHTGNATDGLGRTLQGYGQQFIDMHANSIPGVTRAEEGEERASPTIGTRVPGGPLHPTHDYNPAEHYDHYQSPAQQSLFRSYGELDRAREHDRYEEYLADCDSEKLPHAFDLGWRKNLLHLFGPNPLLWPIPICTTTGDGWRWEPSSKWQEAKSRIEEQRARRWEETNQQQQQFLQQISVQRQSQPTPTHHHSWHASEPHPGSSWTGRFNSTGNVRSPGPYNGNSVDDRPSTGVSMKTLRPMSPRPRPGEGETDIEEVSDHYSTSSDEDTERHALISNDDVKRTVANNDNVKGRAEEWVDWD
ncbi:hypothetical protein FQN49_000289 [Arthroderma sp. PD_2]|nr:hypothetical protein FQN49_000289 [Arthroderma sp. PD_2]